MADENTKLVPEEQSETQNHWDQLFHSIGWRSKKTEGAADAAGNLAAGANTFQDAAKKLVAEAKYQNWLWSCCGLFSCLDPCFDSCGGEDLEDQPRGYGAINEC